MTSPTRPAYSTTMRPPIFHTNSDQVWTISRSSPNGVRTSIASGQGSRQAGADFDQPHNAQRLFGLALETDEEAADYLASRAEPVEDIETSEDVVINAVGRELYELFFQGYTRKRWGLDPSELDKR